MRKHVWVSIFLLVTFGALGWLFFVNQGTADLRPFRFGLDLVGGTELVFRADTSDITDRAEAMAVLKEVVERRVNIFGVSEPLVQTEHAGFASGLNDDRLIVELPGVSDTEEAKRLIGKTPMLEFLLVKPDAETVLNDNQGTELALNDIFISVGLTGQYLSHARVEFNPTTGAPIIGIEFNALGKDLFAKITREHKGERLAIVLDGEMLSAPVIQDEIRDGNAQITGAFTGDEAKALARDLNYGALPVPITFSSSQTIGASLGDVSLAAGVRAGLIGFIALSLFLILWYRLPGLVSVAALCLYTILSLVIFKLIPVTLTAAGIAGFILSVGMAVDANILIFERAKEEKRKGKNDMEAFHEGFHRAWLSIRDSNISSIITAIILFWLGTSAVKGFALTLGIGVLVSMITAISVSRTFLFAIYDRS